MAKAHWPEEGLWSFTRASSSISIAMLLLNPQVVPSSAVEASSGCFLGPSDIVLSVPASVFSAPDLESSVSPGALGPIRRTVLRGPPFLLTGCYPWKHL